MSLDDVAAAVPATASVDNSDGDGSGGHCGKFMWKIRNGNS